jgi:hypothetical protein
MTVADLIRDIREEFPKFKIVQKEDSTFMKTLDVCLKLITFWQMKTFMTRFTTTIGYTIYVPDTWITRAEKPRLIILRHERVHMRQRKTRGWLLFNFAYLFWIFPTVIAHGRMRLERTAYAESMRAKAEYYGIDVLSRPEIRDHTISHFTTAEYFWMWPWRKGLEKWYDETVAKIEREMAE